MSGYGASTLLVHFTGGETGDWRVTSMDTLAGEPLPTVDAVGVQEGQHGASTGRWTLRGVAGHVR